MNARRNSALAQWFPFLRRWPLVGRETLLNDRQGSAVKQS